MVVRFPFGLHHTFPGVGTGVFEPAASGALCICLPGRVRCLWEFRYELPTVVIAENQPLTDLPVHAAEEGIVVVDHNGRIIL